MPALNPASAAPIVAQIEKVGATCTLIAEKLQAAQITLNPWEATVMALGIHGDTGSLTFEQTTPRDALALAWLMQQWANIKTIAEYAEAGFSPALQTLLSRALQHLHQITHHSTQITWVILESEDFIAGLSSLATRLVEITDSDVLLLAVYYPAKVRSETPDSDPRRMVLVGRSRRDDVDLRGLLEPWGGGGHPAAATVSRRLLTTQPEQEIQAWLGNLVAQIQAQVQPPPTARELMSSPVRTIPPHTTIVAAQRILLRYGHAGLTVVDDQGNLLGIISRRDLDLALHHGFGHAPVKGYMTRNPHTIAPQTPLPEIQRLMVTYDIGRLPVLDQGQLLGIVTRTDLLRQLHPTPWDHRDSHRLSQTPGLEQATLAPWQLLQSRLQPAFWDFLQEAAQAAQARGWHLYLVGGAVRDLYLAHGDDRQLLQDIDLVVDGCHGGWDSAVLEGDRCEALTTAAGVTLAQDLKDRYPGARIEVHGRFQTAALLWHQDAKLGSLWVDIATARTEFYPYPAANPEVEASSIRQDLYRRDFSINALAIRLTPPQGELLDFFGGLLDLHQGLVRVLHANSFIEDPTRIYRAVRFAVRLGFSLEHQTLDYLRYALDSGIYDRTQHQNPVAPALQTRLRAELQSLFQASYGQKALKVLGELGALCCLHPQLDLTADLWYQVRLLHHGLRLLPLGPTEARPDHWLMWVEVLLASLPTEDRLRVATKLQLPQDSIDRLAQLDEAEHTIKTTWEQMTQSPHPKPKASQGLQLLRPYPVPLLLLILVRCDRCLGDRFLRQRIWRYLHHDRFVKPPLNGQDLKALGHKPGKAFKPLLDGLLHAYLDGELGCTPDQVNSDNQGWVRSQALNWLKTQ